MLTLKEFTVLRFIEANKTATLLNIAENTKLATTEVAEAVNGLTALGYVDSNLQITANGIEALEPYRVKNAIILAAGMSSRFVPVSYETPKGLIRVKGESMVERQIKQLHEVGITEIIVVVGYLKETFYFLAEKYGVKIVENKEFTVKNSHSSVYAAREYLDNTYILCSDNYYPKNVFSKYEYRALYTSVFIAGDSPERGMIYDENLLIIDTNKPLKDQWAFIGHAYFDRTFSNKYRPILENCYDEPRIAQMFWEGVYLDNIKELDMYIVKYDNDEILEFDSMEELKAFDPDFLDNNKVRAFDYICNELNCEPFDLTDIEIVTKEIDDHSFKFNFNGKRYIYRHPAPESDNFSLSEVAKI